ncbi:MAG TPA: TIGR03619 family F420-dependent LLM class oxidoreductase [Acidimicrobiales bacterium]|nr:TIGR03619 family F420-dependent LLM class oxidoreductase [Acidimicrobiales bacterium]
MRLGVHLPQYGRAAGPDTIRRAAIQAEQLGFADVWVSDHLAIPADAAYPPAFLYEPIVTLTWAAAATTTVRLGTSVLVLPYRHPLHLAKELASLDRLSGGRVTVGAAAGWLEGEFQALGAPFGERGRRTDEAIDVLRACWEGDDPVDFAGRTVTLRKMKVQPRPVGRIPIWVGGASPPALRRATTRGDGWHGTFMNPEQVGPVIAELRSARPEPEFTISLRVAWDGVSGDRQKMREEAEAFAGAGVQHLVVSPSQGEEAAWLRSVELLWETLSGVP